MKKKYIIGIDISTSATGLSLIKNNGSQTPELLYSTVIIPKYKTTKMLKNDIEKESETKIFPSTFTKIIEFRRLFDIEINNIIEKYKLSDYDTMIVVEAFQQKNSNSHIKIIIPLAQINFVIRESIVNCGFSENSIYQYSAASWQNALLNKHSICASAKKDGVKPPTTKELSLNYVENTYGFRPNTDDEADAICLAVAYQKFKLLNVKTLGVDINGHNGYLVLYNFLKNLVPNKWTKMSFKINDKWQINNLSLDDLENKMTEKVDIEIPRTSPKTGKEITPLRKTVRQSNNLYLDNVVITDNYIQMDCYKLVKRVRQYL